MTGISSENRFTIRGPYNEALFVAHEQSSANDRLWRGSGRSFAIQMLDKTHQESLVLERKPECGFCCCLRSEVSDFFPSKRKRFLMCNFYF